VCQSRCPYLGNRWGKGKEDIGTGYTSIPTACSRPVNPCPCQFRQNGPKCIDQLHSMGHETLTGSCEHVLMITPCRSCGHKLWSVERDVKGWLVRVRFDGEETSETYADQVTRCPSCGKWLVEPVSVEAWRSR
jgi:hypothetical protein